MIKKLKDKHHGTYNILIIKRVLNLCALAVSFQTDGTIEQNLPHQIFSHHRLIVKYLF